MRTLRRRNARPALTSRLCERILRLQQPDGSWKSSWDHGPYYGTWIACTALAKLPETAGAREAARAFLLRARRDGGWGIGATPEALSTALAMMTLGVDARTELAAMQQADGLWPAIPLIRMELGRADSAVRQVLTYSSSLVTTAFATRALIAETAATLREAP